MEQRAVWFLRVRPHSYLTLVDTFTSSSKELNMGAALMPGEHPDAQLDRWRRTNTQLSS